MSDKYRGFEEHRKKLREESAQKLIGKTFGWLKILEIRAPKVLCLCVGDGPHKGEAGTIGVWKHRSDVTSLKSTSCGCMRKKKLESTLKEQGVWSDRAGERNGLVVLTKKINSNTYAYRCDCGNTGEVSLPNWISGDQKSCGCSTVELRKQTNLEKYGVENPMQDNEIKDRHKETVLEKYGAENVFATEGVKRKITETSLKKYGTTSPMKNREVSMKITKHVLSSGVSVNEYLIKNQIPYANALNVLKNHGEEAFLEYVESYEDKITSLEIAFQILMKSHFPDLEHFNKKPAPDLNYHPDFKLTNGDKTIYVNVDGLYPHSMKNPHMDKHYHFKMREGYSQRGLTILQFTGDEMYYKKQIVKSIVLSKLGIHEKTYMARRLSVGNVPYRSAYKFFEENHLMGMHVGASSIGLYDGEKLIACMSYKDRGGYFEISRFATLLNTRVQGGFSRLLSKLKLISSSRLGCVNILSFCDLRYGSGDSYKKCGFQLVGTTLGWNWTDTISKKLYRWHCKAGGGKTEKENAQERGLWKIYDAGQAKFVLME
jgi:hypothetical protein